MSPLLFYCILRLEFPESILLHSSSSDTCISHPRTLFFGKRVDRYSYIISKPVEIFNGTHLEKLMECIESHAPGTQAPYPFFSGGAAGVIPYDQGLSFQDIRVKPGALPLYFIISENVIVFDHATSSCYAFGEDSFIKKAESCVHKKPPHLSCVVDPSISLPSKKEYQKSFSKIKSAIFEGETYQVNFSHEFSFSFSGDPFAIYERLARVNPSPQACFVPTPNGTIVSSSPERLVSCKLDAGCWQLESRPIAGTRPRGKTAKDDVRLEKELHVSKKENAEHLMLLDLIRNDMGKISKIGSVHVDEDRVVEKYARVQHLVSSVTAEKSDFASTTDVIKSFFPGGTITGCPKKRTMELIDSLEFTSRGYFYGSAGYISWNKDIDFNILIRTMVCTNNTIRLRVGGGIVYDSTPVFEYDETFQKAASQLESLGILNVRIPKRLNKKGH